MPTRRDWKSNSGNLLLKGLMRFTKSSKRTSDQVSPISHWMLLSDSLKLLSKSRKSSNMLKNLLICSLKEYKLLVSSSLGSCWSKPKSLRLKAPSKNKKDNKSSKYSNHPSPTSARLLIWFRVLSKQLLKKARILKEEMMVQNLNMDF